MKNQEIFNCPFGQWLGRLDGRLTNLNGFVTGHLFKDRKMGMWEKWEELGKEFSGNK